MYKMKEVCCQTGLTEKAVRLYVEQGLVAPKTETGLHYRSFLFAERDIQRLKDISALRSAGFSIAQIRQMLEDPNAIPSLVAQMEASLGEEIQTKQSMRLALESLTAQERTDFSQIADAIEPRTPLRRETPKGRRNRLLWAGIYAGLFLLLSLPIPGGIKIPGMALALIAGISFPIMAMAYLRYNRQYRKLPQRASGTVVDVISDEGVEESWEETGAETLYRLMQTGFLHWSWVRPDHYVPLIQYAGDGGTVTVAYRYGGLKHSWRAGQAVKIAWASGKENQIYPCDDPVIRMKGLIYLLAGFVSMAVFFILLFCR